MNKQRIAILIACCIGSLASLMNWQDYFLTSTSGVELGYGWFTLGLFSIGGVICLVSNKTKQLTTIEILATIIPAIMATGIAAFAYVKLQNTPAPIKKTELDFIVELAKSYMSKTTLGVGLYITIVAGVAVPVLAFALKQKKEIIDDRK